MISVSDESVGGEVRTCASSVSVNVWNTEINGGVVCVEAD